MRVASSTQSALQTAPGVLPAAFPQLSAGGAATPASTVANASTIPSNMGGVDASMDSTVGVRRSRQDAGFDDSEAGFSDDLFEHNENRPPRALPQDPEKLITEAETAATAAIGDAAIPGTGQGKSGL